MRPAPKAVQILTFVLAAAFLLGPFAAGCGGPSAPPPPKGGPGNPPPHKKLIKDELTTEEDEAPDNPRWKLIAEHFQRFTRRPASMHKDMFKSHLDKYVEKIEIADLVQEDEEDAAPIEDVAEDLDPLKKFPADEYKVVAIMTGVGRPAALLKDPKGSAYAARVDSEVGNEGGVVEAITQYEVVIRNPAEPKPVRLNIRPEMFDISKRQEEERAVQEEATDQL